MKTDAAFVRPDRVAVLHAVAAVHLHFPPIIYPGDAKGYNAVGLGQAGAGSRVNRYPAPQVGQAERGAAIAAIDGAEQDRKSVV